MQFLAGYKSYLTAAAMVAYAVLGYFVLNAMDGNTFATWLAGAGALIGIRSGVTTEFQKLLAALGVDVMGGSASTPSAVQASGSKLLSTASTMAKAVVSQGAVKALTVLLLVCAMAPALSACATYNALFGGGSAPTTVCSTPSQCVYQAKGVFAGSLALLGAYGGLPACPQPTPVCKDESTFSTLRDQAHTIQSDLDLADQIVNSGLLPSGQAATDADKQAAAKKATIEAAAFNTTASALPHR